MKYLFYVHSHITDRVASQIVLHLGLDVADCVFLLARNHQSDFPNQQLFPYHHYPVDSFRVSVFFWKNRKKVDELDAWLTKLTNGEKIIFYTPQSGMNFFYLIVNHHLCQSYCYLEEGLCSYLPEAQLQSTKKQLWLREILYGLNFKNRVPSVKHFYNLQHPKYLAAYGLSEHSFPGLTKRVQLPFPKSKKNEEGEYQHVIVLGQYVEYGEIQLDTLLKSMRYLIEWLVDRKIKTVHVKYHPAQQEKISVIPLRKLFEEFGQELNVHTIPPEVVLENIALTSDAHFYIISSSVGIYATITGNQVYCLAQQVVNLEPAFQKKIDAFPEFLKKELQFI